MAVDRPGGEAKVKVLPPCRANTPWRSATSPGREKILRLDERIRGSEPPAREVQPGWIALPSRRPVASTAPCSRARGQAPWISRSDVPGPPLPDASAQGPTRHPSGSQPPGWAPPGCSGSVASGVARLMPWAFRMESGSGPSWQAQERISLSNSGEEAEEDVVERPDLLQVRHMSGLVNHCQLGPGHRRGYLAR